MIENGSIQIFILCKRIDSIVALGDDVVIQPFFKVACTINLLFASHEIVTVIIHILLDKSVNEFCFTAKFGILNHRVNNVPTLFRVVLAVWVEIRNQFQNVSHIDDVAMQQFQAEIDVSQPCSIILTRVWFGSHT